MSEKNETPNKEQTAVQAAAAEATECKKPFVEPEVSVPVDVLETTTFFQNNVESVPLP